jgi:hypothetical protein
MLPIPRVNRDIMFDRSRLTLIPLPCPKSLSLDRLAPYARSLPHGVRQIWMFRRLLDEISDLFFELQIGQMPQPCQ